MNSPRFAPGRTPWLVTDDRSELIREIRLSAEGRGLAADVSPVLLPEPDSGPPACDPHSTFGYLIQAEQRGIVWAPEFCVFPEWAEGCDLMFA